MKASSLIWALGLMMGWCINPAFSVEYCKDFLEPGNPGGWSESLKTFDEEWTLRAGNTIDLDIWINDVPEKLITAGFILGYDPSLASIVGVDVYDGSLPGPWDGIMTNKAPDPTGPGSYMVLVGNLGAVSPDAGGDIPIARIRVACPSPADASITFRTIPDFDTVVGNSATVYDSELVPNTIVIAQGRPVQCPAEVLYGHHSREAELLRHFRDNVLMQTPEGRELITLYYQWSPALTGAIEDDASFRKEVMELIDSVVPIIRKAVE